MKKKIFLLLATSLLLVSCGAKKQSTIDDNPAQDPPSVDPEPPVPPEPDWPTDAKTMTLTFLNNAEFGTGFLNDSAPKQKFITAFNSEVNILKDITVYGSVQMANNDSSACYINNTLQFGSRTSDGTITFEFNYDIIGVTMNSQPYWTSYSYGQTSGYSVDQYANQFVRADEYAVDFGTVELGKEPDKKETTFDFSNRGPSKEFSIYNKMNRDTLPDKQGQRSYLHSLTLIYLDE